MKFFAVIIAIFALAIATAVGLKDPVCGLEHSMVGDGKTACYGYMPSFSYKSATNECAPFIYGGCGGNANRFSTKEDCEKKCKE